VIGFDFQKAYEDAAKLDAIEATVKRFLELQAISTASPDLRKLLAEVGPAIERIWSQSSYEAEAAYASIRREEERTCGCGGHQGDVQ
jgi:hypothetical protein